ncbi:MAG TPA: hypothetical protein VNN21_06910, partial [Dehalococcoidia bacterium]|nr:hypothetical protein [Dehalococcoidia bacterium]
MSRYDRTLVYGSLIVMEAMWAYALVAFFVALTVGGGKPTYFGVLAVVGASFAISRLLQGFEFSLGVLRAWGVLLSVLVFYAVVRIDFYGDWRLWDFTWADELFNHTEATLRDDATVVIGAPLLFGFWVRGVLRGQEYRTFEDVAGSFALGVVVVGLVALFGTFVDELPRAVELISIPYVAVGLAAIGLAHASRARDGGQQPFVPVWLASVGGAIAGLAIVALLFALVDFSTAQAGIEAAARGAGFVLAGVVYVIVWPMLKLVELGFEVMKWLIELYGGRDPNPDQAPQQPLEPPPRPEDDGGGLPGWVGVALRAVVAGGLTGAVLLAVAVLFARVRRTPRPGEVKESTYQEGRLAADLGSLVGAMLGRLRPSFRIGSGDADPARRLYFDMLA